MLSCSSAMPFAILYALVRLVDAVVTFHQSDVRLRAEVLALRHQLRALPRQVRRPRWEPADRLFLSAPQPPPTPIILVILAPQPRDPPPMAPPSRPPTLGSLPITATPPVVRSKTRTPRADRPSGPGEPALGLSPHPGRDPQAQPPLLPPDRLPGPPSPCLRPAPRRSHRSWQASITI